MARSLLGSFVSGTRQMLFVQLLVSVGAVALTGYTLAVTNNAIRERDRLNERVIQLEQTLVESGVSTPAPNPEPVRDTPEPPKYPGSEGGETVIEQVPPEPEAPTESPRDETPPAPEQAPVETPVTPPREAPAPSGDAGGQTAGEPARPAPNLDLAAQLLRDLLTPPPPLRNVVLHIRSRADYDEARRIAAALAGDSLSFSIAIMGPNDATQTGYAYYHGRQSRAAAELAQRVQDAARSAEIAAWSAQLRGTALPAQGDYTPDRLDIVLPALPAEQPPVRSVNPQILRQRARTQIQPPAVQQPDPDAPR
jgi:hypothetical protein